MDTLVFDVIIVGGGPAGLSAAMILARCRRRVLLCDEGKPRNRWSHALHGYLTRDCTPPLEFLQLARDELLRYDVDYRNDRAIDAVRADGLFEVTVAGGACFRAKKLLLTTGVVDLLPKIPGFKEMYGQSVHHCPYCDGWEVRDQPLAAFGSGKVGAGLAETLRIWSPDVVLCLNGEEGPDAEALDRLQRNDVRIRAECIRRLEGKDGQLERIVFETGPPLERRALFFNTGQFQKSDLATKLGCDFNDKGTAVTDKQERSNVPGVFVAGDASEDVQFVIVAAAEGAKAAMAINKELCDEQLL